MKTIYYCFPGGRHKALTMSYDDGPPADRKLVALFNAHGIRGSFHLNGGLLGVDGRVSASEARDLYAGHEISCHTFTHPTIARCPKELVAQQILEDRKALEEVAGYPVRGMSFPNGSFDQDIIAMLPHLGIEYARTVFGTGSFALPDDFLRWNATCHHNNGLLERAKEFAGLSKTQYLYLLYVWGHSYEFDNDKNWHLIEEFCALAGRRDEVWYATNIEIVDYMHACKQLRFTAALDRVQNPTASPVWISVDGGAMRIEPGQTAWCGGLAKEER